MIRKMFKLGIVVMIIVIGGAFFFGDELFSYATSSVRSARRVVKDKVPVEFELQRAKDLLEEIIPEMHANIKMIAQEEVEIAALKNDITFTAKSLQEQKQKVSTLQTSLSSPQVQFTFAGRDYSRQQVKNDLVERFNRFKEAKVIYASKQRILSSRENSLTSAMTMLEKTRSQKRLLQEKIAALESQNKLVKAASVGSKFNINDTKLAKTEKLIGQIKKRLDVAERVLAHESRFTESIPVETVSEQDIMLEINDYFNPQEENSGFEVEAKITLAKTK